MAETGDWLVPRFQGEPFFDKPALTYWLMAAALKLFGPHLAAARLVPVGAALGALGATVWLGRSRFSRETAAAGGLVLATTLLFLSFGRVAMSDMLLTLWCTLAVTAGLAAARATGRRADLGWGAVGAALGLGFLTKGPIALVLAGSGLFALLLVEPRLGPAGERWPVRWPRARGWLLAALAFAVLGLGWFVALWWRLGPGPLAHFFLHENLERFAGEAYDSGRSPLYYLGTFLAVGLPWSLVFPIAALRAWREVRGLVVWLVLMAIPLSLARGKIDYYLLPLLPAASLVTGRYLAGTAWGALDRQWARSVLAVVAAACAMLPLAEARLPTAWLPGPGAQVVFVTVTSLAALALALAAIRPSPPRFVAALAFGVAAVALTLVTRFLPAFRAAQPNAAVVADVGRELAYRPDARVVACGDPARVRRDLLFDLRVTAEERCDVWNPAASHQPFLLLVDPAQLASLRSIPALREIEAYPALPATAFTLGGLLAGPQPEVFALVANFKTEDPVAENKRRRDRKHALRAAAAAGAEQEK